MKGWKTLLFAAILAIAGMLEQFDWVSIVPEGWSGVVLAVVGIIVAWLRSVTTTPTAVASKATIVKAKADITAMAKN